MATGHLHGHRRRVPACALRASSYACVVVSANQQQNSGAEGRPNARPPTRGCLQDSGAPSVRIQCQPARPIRIHGRACTSGSSHRQCAGLAVFRSTSGESPRQLQRACGGHPSGDCQADTRSSSDPDESDATGAATRRTPASLSRIDAPRPRVAIRRRRTKPCLQCGDAPRIGC